VRASLKTGSVFEIIDWAFGAFAAALLLGMLAGALHDVSRAWDTWYYHLPFAARLGGIADRTSFELSNINRARFAGFPLLAEAIQAALWRLAGTPVAANLLAFSSVPLFAVFLRRRFRVPLHVSILGLLAVPLVQIHATSCYVDLPANTALGVVVLSVFAAYADSSAPTVAELNLSLFFAAVASNMKFLLEPIVCLSIVMLALRVVFELRGAPSDIERGAALRKLARIAVAAPFVFGTALKNVIVHHNPAFPERMQLLGVTLPGLEQPYHSSPVWLKQSSEPVRFFVSIFELHLPPLLSHARWSIDQWSPPWRDEYRMGGFFGAYVAFELCVLGFHCLRTRSRATRVAAVGFGLFTLVTCFMPQAHELRYYLGWMIVLVALNRWLSSQPGSEKLGTRALAAASTGFLCAVLFSTRCGYVYPSGITLRQLIAQETNAKALSTVAEGESVCVQRLPFALLWAAPFHPGHHYRLKQAEASDDCIGYRPLD